MGIPKIYIEHRSRLVRDFLEECITVRYHCHTRSFHSDNELKKQCAIGLPDILIWEFTTPSTILTEIRDMNRRFLQKQTRILVLADEHPTAEACERDVFVLTNTVRKCDFFGILDGILRDYINAHGLTEREMEVVQLLVQGCSNCEIAGQLCVSPGAVKAHLSNIFKKLNVADRTQAVVHAIQHRITPGFSVSSA